MTKYKNWNKCLKAILSITIAFFIGNVIIDAIFNDSIEWTTALLKAIIATSIVYLFKHSEKMFFKK